MTLVRQLRIAILKCDFIHPSIANKLGDYGVLYTNLLRRHSIPNVNVETHVFECTQNEFTEAAFHQTKHSFNGYLISGSKNGAYEDLPWINDLKQTVRQMQSEKSTIFGVCFGHQLIAEALGGKVAPSPKGWEFGHSTFTFTDPATTEKREVSMMQVHKDSVERIPPGFRVIAENEHSIQGMISDDGKIITLQAHPEFSEEIIEKLANLRKESLPEDVYQRTLASLKNISSCPLSTDWAANLAVSHFLKQA